MSYFHFQLFFGLVSLEMVSTYYTKAWSELISDLLAGASNGMEIPSCQEVSLVNYRFGTFLEEKFLKESKDIQVCVNYSYSQIEWKVPIFQLC